MTTIPNWSFFGTHSVYLQVMECTIEEGTFYQGAISIWLDDGQELSEDVEEQKTITLMVDIMSDSKEDVFEQMMAGSEILGFPFVPDDALILRENGDVENFDLTTLLEG